MRSPGYVARDLAQSPLAARGNPFPKNQVVLSSEDRCSLARRFQDSCEEVMMRTHLYICFVTRFYPHERSLSLSLSFPTLIPTPFHSDSISSTTDPSTQKLCNVELYNHHHHHYYHHHNYSHHHHHHQHHHIVDDNPFPHQVPAASNSVEYI